MREKPDGTVATLFVTSASAAALWEGELKGQISDGAWENSLPHNHWKFWCDTDVEIGDRPAIEYHSYQRPKKSSYGFAKQLMEYVGDRMLKIGRMGLAINKSPYVSDDEIPSLLRIAEEMPDSHPGYHLSAFNFSQYTIDHYANALTPAVIQAYYSTEYTIEDLKKDLRMISRAMKSLI